jgi:hypothetical protein
VTETPDTPEQPARPTAREIADLLAEREQMVADAGGWSHLVPTERVIAWEVRKDDLLARITACQPAPTDDEQTAHERDNARDDEGRGWSL